MIVYYIKLIYVVFPQIVDLIEKGLAYRASAVKKPRQSYSLKFADPTYRWRRQYAELYACPSPSPQCRYQYLIPPRHTGVS